MNCRRIGNRSTACGRFAHIQSHPQQDAEGRIGFMARVVQSGPIAVGDVVRVEALVRSEG